MLYNKFEWIKKNHTAKTYKYIFVIVCRDLKNKEVGYSVDKIKTTQKRGTTDTNSNNIHHSVHTSLKLAFKKAKSLRTGVGWSRPERFK